MAEEWQLSQCLFGEHLLNTYPDKVVVLVESEKVPLSALLSSPGYVWLATGGKSQLGEEKLRVLTGRTVLLFPDADGYAEWKQRAGSMTYCKAVVSDIIEKNATPDRSGTYRHCRLDCLPDTGKQNKLYSRPLGGSRKNPPADDREESRPAKGDGRLRPCTGRCIPNRQR